MKSLLEYISESRDITLQDVKDYWIGKECYDYDDNKYTISDVWTPAHVGTLPEAEKAYTDFLKKYDSTGSLEEVTYDDFLNGGDYKSYGGLVAVQDDKRKSHVFVLDDEDGIRLRK